jgi:ABC-type phosphate/phosphonate transport system permease subunit
MGLSDYQKLFGTAIVLVIAVTIIDRFSSYLRQKFI